jgi:hypothetical protein
MISILLAVRKNSKFFSKWLISYLKHTKNFSNIELLILANSEDTWNQDYFDYYKLNVLREDFRCGKDGRFIFYNYLAERANGGWLWHMCDDHYLLDGYDEYLTKYITDKAIDSSKINILIPRVENSGAISHILSRGWYATVGMGKHGNIDSYINEVVDKMIHTQCVFRPEQSVLIDYTVDPTIMTPEHCKIELDPEHRFYDFTDPHMKDLINQDAHKLYVAIGEGK